MRLGSKTGLDSKALLKYNCIITLLQNLYKCQFYRVLLSRVYVADIELLKNPLLKENQANFVAVIIE